MCLSRDKIGRMLTVTGEHVNVLEWLRTSAKQFDDEIQRDKDAALQRACPESSTND